MQWFQRFAFPQDLFAGIRPAFLCFRGRVCAPCPVAQDSGVVPNCNSLPVCLLTLSERCVLFCLHLGINFKVCCWDLVQASTSSVCK